MRRLKDVPIKLKVILITMVTAGFAVLVMTLTVIINEAFQQREFVYEKRQEQLFALASVIGSRSTAALQYDDPQVARENLQALQNLQDRDHILLATIQDRYGEAFALYRPARGQQGPEQPSLSSRCNDVVSQREAILVICTPILLDEEQIGETRIVFDMKGDLKLFRERMRRFTMLVVGALLLTFALAFLLSSRLQRHISAPILQLREAMELVSSNRDYSIRVPATRRDELGVLSTGFNDMLSQIMERDAALATHSETLEAEVRLRTQELEEANKRRVSWLENLARFLRHEFRNTIVGVKTSLDLIERRAGSESSLAPYVARARASVSNMGKLLDGVTNASTLEAAVQKEPKGPLNLSDVVTKAVREFVEAHQPDGIQCKCQQGLEITGSELLVRQLLFNLLCNAIDHRRKGTAILVTLKKRNENALLSVANEGVPLPKNRDRIFDLFVSIRTADQKRDGNIGFGLNLVKLIAQSHGGGASAEPLPDKPGAVFTVSFPLRPIPLDRPNDSP